MYSRENTPLDLNFYKSLSQVLLYLQLLMEEEYNILSILISSY